MCELEKSAWKVEKLSQEIEEIKEKTKKGSIQNTKDSDKAQNHMIV